MISDNQTPIIALKDISIDESNTVDSPKISIEINMGDVHALFADDPDFLIRILHVISGSEKPFSGTILFDGHPLIKHNPRKAAKMGIEIIDRTPKCFLNLTVLENVFAERSSTLGNFFRFKKNLRREAMEFFSKLGFNFTLNKRVEEFSYAEQKLIEIARSICASPRLLLIEGSLMDDIQQNLKPGTIEKLNHQFAMMIQTGTTIIFTSTDMNHIFSFAKTISIIKKGSVHKTSLIQDIDKLQLVQMTYGFIVSRNELERSNLNYSTINKFIRK